MGYTKILLRERTAVSVITFSGVVPRRLGREEEDADAGEHGYYQDSPQNPPVLCLEVSGVLRIYHSLSLEISPQSGAHHFCYKFFKNLAIW